MIYYKYNVKNIRQDTDGGISFGPLREQTKDEKYCIIIKNPREMINHHIRSKRF